MMIAAAKATARMSATITPITVPVEVMVVSPVPVTEHTTIILLDIGNGS